MKSIKHLLLLLLFTITGTIVAHAQENKDQAKAVQTADLKKIADSKSFIFKAEYANIEGEASLNGSFVNNTPTGAQGHIFLNGEYSVTVSQDSVSSYLPYFGNDQIEDKPNTPGYISVTLYENPAKFSSQKFDYSVQQKKKGNVQITITPQDNKKIEKLIFEILPTGNGKLTVTIANVRSIIYDGKLIK